LYKKVLNIAAIKYSALEDQKLEESNLAINDIVTIPNDRVGIVRYIGEAHFFFLGSGYWN